MQPQLITVALREEALGLVKVFTREIDERGNFLLGDLNGNGQNQARVLVTGMGSENAISRVTQAISQSRPANIISIGFAGAIQSQLKPGTVVIPEEITWVGGSPRNCTEDRERGPIQIDAELKSKAVAIAKSLGHTIIGGRLLTVPNVVRTTGYKMWLGKQYGASAVDMETYGLADVARSNNIPFVSVRYTVDGYNLAIPRVVAGWNLEANTLSKVANLAWHLTRHPKDLFTLAQLGIWSHRAKSELGKFTRVYMEEVSRTNQTVA